MTTQTWLSILGIVTPVLVALVAWLTRAGNKKLDAIVYELSHTNDGGTVKGKLITHDSRLERIEQWAHMTVHQLNRQHPGEFTGPHEGSAT